MSMHGPINSSRGVSNSGRGHTPMLKQKIVEVGNVIEGFLHFKKGRERERGGSD